MHVLLSAACASPFSVDAFVSTKLFCLFHVCMRAREDFCHRCGLNFILSLLYELNLFLDLGVLSFIFLIRFVVRFFLQVEHKYPACLKVTVPV